MGEKDFFEKIKVPASWRYEGTNNVTDGDVVLSYGRVYSNGTPGLLLKVFYMPAPRDRGGLVERTSGRYNMVTDNKTAEKLNEYLEEFYI